MSEIIIQKNLGDALAPRYKAYAHETLQERAIPDIRDGLKPVHLRILYCMYHDLKLTANHKHIKSAKVSGAVMGSYHPHSSSYDTMISMSQEWAMRYPIVDIFGNNGSIDGDPAAADRYTECRLTKYGEAMMSDIEKNVIDFKPTYDDTSVEPVVASGLISNYLLNSLSGIACGFSTNSASHNLTEVYEAFDYILKQSLEDEEVSVAHLATIIQGPDWPTGGIIVNNADWFKIFTEGRGKVVTRAKYEIISDKKKTYMKVTEIPYGVNKLKLVNSIEQKIDSGILTDIKEVIDASSEGNVNIQIIFKKNANVDLVVSNLLAKTDLQANFNYNMTTLLNKQLQQSSIVDALYAFIEHGLEVIKRRSQFDLDKMNRRCMLLEGIIKVLEDLDTTIDIIRTHDDPLTDLMNQFELEEEQAQYILDMKLRRISNADEEKIEAELSELYDEIPKLIAIINDEKVTMQKLREELAEIKDKFGDERRTQIDIQVNSSINEEDLIEDEDLVITITSDGNIKSVSASAYNTQNRGGKGNKGANVKDDEEVVDLFSVRSKDDLLFITNTGRCHVLKAYKIPKVARNAKGKNIVNYLKLDEGEFPISTIATNVANNQDATLVLATKYGMIKRLKLNMLSSKYSVTKVAKLKEGDEFVKAVIGSDHEEVLLVSEKGNYVRFSLALVRAQGKTAIGVQGMKFKTPDDYVLTMTIMNDNEDLVVVTEKGIGKKTAAKDFTTFKNRGGKGNCLYKSNERTGRVSACIPVTHEDLLITTANGSVIRINSENIKKLSMTAQGVKLINLNENDAVASIAKLVPQKNNEEGESIE